MDRENVPLPEAEHTHSCTVRALEVVHSLHHLAVQLQVC